MDKVTLFFIVSFYYIKNNTECWKLKIYYSSYSYYSVIRQMYSKNWAKLRVLKVI